MSEGFSLFFLFFPVFLFSLSFHECAHAWMANRLGDPTARMLGRLTLNPLAHIDWIGTFLFPLLMFLMPGLILFGWAKPVPVDPHNLRGGRRGNLKVAAAGPISNLLLSLLFALLFHLINQIQSAWVPLLILGQMLKSGVYLNLMLAFFNLIPLHPLDGGNVLEGILPLRYLPAYEQIGRYGFLILIAALYLGILRYLTVPVYFIAKLLLT